MIDTIVMLFFIIGLFFFIVGTIGLLRLPDVYTRMHATTKCDTLGAMTILTGLAVYSVVLGAPGSLFISGKMILIATFIFVANPTSAHAIAKAAYLSGVKLWEGSVFDMYGKDAKKTYAR
ncbi:MAG: monovalent cation/H(+) antiporter subunit G [Candidatus Hydrothermarchaeales archaeon]